MLYFSQHNAKNVANVVNITHNYYNVFPIMILCKNTHIKFRSRIAFA